MQKPKNAKLRRFISLAEFKEESNNFCLYFIRGSFGGEVYRTFSHFKRFKRNHPELEKSLTRMVSFASQENRSLPYTHLFKAYKIMSKYVRYNDPDVIDSEGLLDEYFLCR